MEYLGFSSRRQFNERYMKPLLESGQLLMTLPDKPQSKNQKYITAKQTLCASFDSGGQANGQASTQAVRRLVRRQYAGWYVEPTEMKRHEDTIIIVVTLSLVKNNQDDHNHDHHQGGNSGGETGGD